MTVTTTEQGKTEQGNQVAADRQAEQQAAQLALDLSTTSLPAINREALQTSRLEVIRLKPHQEVILRGFRGILTDNDDTIARGSGELAHDGHLGAYAQFISKKLVEQFPDLADGTDFDKHGTIFSKKDWHEYREQLGGTPASNIERILHLAERNFGRDGFKVPRAEYEHLAELDALYQGGEAVDAALQSHWLDSILPDLNLLSFIDHANVPTAMVTASGEVYTRTILKRQGLQDRFKTVVCNASKKTHDGFSGEDIHIACKQLGVSPDQAIMFGDTMSDIGAAKLAGVPITIIRPYEHDSENAGIAHAPEEHHEMLLEKIKGFENRDDYSSILASSPYPLTVIIVDCFSQVRSDSPSQPSGDMPSYEVRTKN